MKPPKLTVRSRPKRTVVHISLNTSVQENTFGELLWTPENLEELTVWEDTILQTLYGYRAVQTP